MSNRYSMQSGGRWREFGSIFSACDRPPRDIQDVLDAANLLEIGEFKLFSLAYAEWFNSQPDDSNLDHFFIRYMFEGQVPSWVRSFSRKVIRLHGEGEIDQEELGVEAPSTRLYNVRLGLMIFTLIFMTQVLIFFMAYYAAGEFPGLFGRCLLPPCY